MAAEQITHGLMFGIFRDAWVFDKLSGKSEPTFLKPIEIAERIKTTVEDGRGHPRWWMEVSLPVLRQLNWQQLIQAQHLDRKYKCYRLSGYASRLLYRGHYYSLSQELEWAKKIESTIEINVYANNRATEYR